MFRLNKKAYKILVTELERAAARDNLAGEVAKKLALKRLKNLRHTKGTPANKAELNDLLRDILPYFSQKALKKAAKANRKPSVLWIIPKAGISLVSIAGLVWLINLPYPMIRRPVARTAPILLLPSYLSMDRNYRKAIAKVEQADRLVNQATSLADLELGTEKVKQAQKHLDALPVWFLGYEPRIFMTWFRFSWMFTLDEFKAARASVGRMEAKIFQEKNAMAQLEKSETAIENAKKDYQQAKDLTEKQQAIANWQRGIDELEQIPDPTLAGKMAATKLKAYSRDFQQIYGLIIDNDLNNTVIAAAQQFASKATSSCQNSANSVHRWQQCAKLWQQAIQRLHKVELGDPGYLEAQTLLANYETNLGEVEISERAEAEAVRIVDSAYQQITRLPKQVNSNNCDRIIGDIQNIIYQLEKVPASTTVYQEAQSLISSAHKKLQNI